MFKGPEQGGEKLPGLEKIKQYCAGFENVNIVSGDSGFLVEVFDAENEQQAVYVFDTSGNLVSSETSVNELAKLVPNLEEVLIVYSNKESSDRTPAAQQKNFFVDKEGHA